MIFLPPATRPSNDLTTNKRPDRDHLGGRRSGQRHLHHGRRDAQRSVQQLNRRRRPTPPGIKVKPALPAMRYHAASAVNLVTESGSTRCTAMPSSAELHFNARILPARDSLNRNQFGNWRPDRQNKLFFGGYQAASKEQPARVDQLRPDAGDAEQRLHDDRVAGNGGRQLTLGGGCQQPIDPSRLNQWRSFPQHCRVVRSCGSCMRIPNNNTEHQLSESPTRSTGTRRCSRATSTRSTTTRRPGTARTS